jgi:hypothetical protein
MPQHLDKIRKKYLSKPKTTKKKIELTDTQEMRIFKRNKIKHKKTATIGVRG